MKKEAEAFFSLVRKAYTKVMIDRAGDSTEMELANQQYIVINEKTCANHNERFAANIYNNK